MAFFGNRRQPDPDTEDRDTQPRLTVQQPIGFETVLGANSVMEGTFKSSGNVRMDGTFTGTLEISGNILVGETARITADIDARNISIAGAVRGNVTGNKVQLLRTGRVWGDINASALTTEDGAFIDGRITMKGHAASRQDTPDLEATKPQLESKVVETAEVVAIPPIPDDETILSRPDKTLDETIPLPPLFPTKREDSE
jgi:cytoskeletal protein CcmA (bactofilin family)